MEILKKYIPESSIEQVIVWLKQYKIYLKVTKSRKSKFGDYRAPHNKKPATITINHDLNQYHFLITLVHEIAHASVWEQYNRKAKPHGKEWQKDYSEKLSLIISLSVFPEELLMVLQLHLSNVKASTCSDHKLYRMLKVFDEPNDFVFLSEIANNTLFEVKGGRRFIKGEKRRTRYLCREVNSNKNYTISGNAEVKPLTDQGNKSFSKLTA